MPEDKKRIIRKAISRMTAEEFENLWWYLITENLI